MAYSASAFAGNGAIANQLQAITDRNNAISIREAQKNRDWQTAMSNTAHQRQVQDLTKAGLNPILSANSGAQVAAPAQPTIDDSLVNSLVGIINTQANNSAKLEATRIQKQAQLQAATLAANAQLSAASMSAAAQRHAADKHYQASVYASDRSYASSKYSADKSYDAKKLSIEEPNWNSFGSQFGHVTKYVHDSLKQSYSKPTFDAPAIHGKRKKRRY